MSYSHERLCTSLMKHVRRFSACNTGVGHSREQPRATANKGPNRILKTTLKCQRNPPTVRSFTPTKQYGKQYINKYG